VRTLYIIQEKTVRISLGELILEGNLTIPKGAEDIILFAHGSGSSRYSPRNRYVAEVLQKAGLATLLIDLLTKEEEMEDRFTGHFRFDIEMLSDRLISASQWLLKETETRDFAIGYFGASTGAGAALIAAAKYPEAVHAIVSRGGRPDLALQYLSKVKAPTLLIVGGNDTLVIEMNEEALKHLSIRKKIEIVQGASHLFEEPGTLEEVARLAAAWFVQYLNHKSLKENNFF